MIPFTFKGWFKRNNKAVKEYDTVTVSKSPFVFNMTGAQAPSGYADQSKFPQANGITFTVYPATGGHILEFKSYDPSVDRLTTRLHVIPEGASFADLVAETVTLECLRGK